MIRRPPRSTRTTHSFPTRRSSDLLVPDLGGALIGGLWLGSFAVVGGRSFEHQRSPSERLTVEPPPWASPDRTAWAVAWTRSEEHTSELQSLMRISYAVFCLKKKKTTQGKQSIQYLTVT